jgi:hypothetical protein
MAGGGGEVGADAAVALQGGQGAPAAADFRGELVAADGVLAPLCDRVIVSHRPGQLCDRPSCLTTLFAAIFCLARPFPAPRHAEPLSETLPARREVRS